LSGGKLSLEASLVCVLVKTILVLIVWKFLPTQIFKGKDIFSEADFGKDFMANDFFMIFFSCNELLVG
jgi:hypothetical protein